MSKKRIYLVPVETASAQSERFHSRCNIEDERMALIENLKKCYSETEIDNLFQSAGVEDCAVRAAILRECMNAVYIISSGIPDPALEGMTKEQLSEVEYEMEKSTFLDGYWR